MLSKKRKFSGKFKKGLSKKKPYNRTALRIGGLPSGSERKYIDNYLSTPVNDVPAFMVLSQVAQGAGPTQRIGRKLVSTSINFRGTIRLTEVSPNNATPTAVDITNLAPSIRLMIVYDRQPNGVAALLNEVLDVSVAGYTEAQNNDQNKDRFMILVNRSVDVSGSLVAGGGATRFATDLSNASKTIDFYQKIPRLETIYGDAGTGAIADHRSGALLFFIVSDSPTSCYEFNGSIRLRYIDR